MADLELLPTDHAQNASLAKHNNVSSNVGPSTSKSVTVTAAVNDEYELRYGKSLDGDLNTEIETGNCEISINIPTDEIIQESDATESPLLKPKRTGKQVAFVRGVTGKAATHEPFVAQPGLTKLSRLSSVIRRSLRLGPKRTVYTTTERKAQPKYPEGDPRATPFSPFTDLRRQPCEEPYGTIGELRYMLQMNRHTQVIFYEQWRKYLENDALIFYK
ncbi:hypothetical protein DdX_03856 [Ditylenchus destructor]|uniref:Uncharacterized protein n=1 Tax=Ditylenchus destructor TaxID=166010 RepID=A0AAD4RBM3_9BILA|nr:hypothetical protein DdX_03856 [Ditylenchus destructor]